MKAFYSFLLLVAVAFTACNEETTNKLIQLADGTSTSLVFNADESGDATIKFTADAAWTASVSEVAASKSGESISWLSLSPYGGEAGENTITVSLLKNYTGASRKAEIKIVCGDSEIIITVEQKGETSTGTVAKKIKEIVYKETDNSSVDTGNTPYEEEYSLKFSYFEDGNVARITKDETDYYGEKSTITYKFNYDIVGEIQVEEKESDYYETYNYVVKLDDRGNATELRENGEIMATFGYTNDVRLGKVVTYEYGDEDEQHIFSYENGLMSKYTYDDGYEDADEYTFDGSYYTNKYPNNGMIDIMSYIGGGFDFDFLFYIGRLAKTSDYCLEKIPGYGNDMAENVVDMDDSRLKNPNTLIETVTGMSAKFSDEPVPVEYTYDGDNNITSIKISVPYDVNSYSYEIWTTGEYREKEKWDEEKQEYVTVRYYYTETRNRKSEFVKSGTDYYTYTINY